MAATGNAGYVPKPGMENRWHVVGPGDNPVNIIRKGDIPGLFTEKFWGLYQIWTFFHNGFGLPGGCSWDELDAEVSHMLLAMEIHYRERFSESRVTLQYLEAIIKRMDVYAKARAKAGL